ncbi:MAG TPA: oligopeptide transporter, OPT family [Pirellulales bacterium]|nr:oligopeptide transporter, OPT family [Pirellulales bacterium]
MAKTTAPRPAKQAASGFQPYVADDVAMPELTWQAVLVGVVLGIVFGASSLYLVLKVGLTVSASIPVAVLSITLFRGLARMFRLRPATILENNIVQTTGSAGESIAFGVGVTMPALLLLGHDMDVVRVMTVGALGGLLGILMMIPLRRAFIVKQHGRLTYPEGTACAEVLIAGEEGGQCATTVFVGFGLAFLSKVASSALRLWNETPVFKLIDSTGRGLPAAEIGGEMVPELLGVGYIIGPRISSVMLAGGVLSALVLTPLIAFFSANQSRPIDPVSDILIRDMTPAKIRLYYVLYIGAGAVTAGGIISLAQALPLIVGSLRSGLSDLARSRAGGEERAVAIPRTARDLPFWVTAIGSLALVVAMLAIPNLGLGFHWFGLLGAALIVGFGFLFVAVSSRLTGEIGSSSNPISGMTVATLLFTCLAFVAVSHNSKVAVLSAVTIAGVVCVAASNGGTTAQDLKTGFLVGATPIRQQWAIVVGALTSALVIGGTLLLLNQAGTIYSQRPPQGLPRQRVPDVKQLTTMERAGGQYADDQNLYHVLNVSRRDRVAGVPPGKYLVDDAGQFRYYVDPAINGRLMGVQDDGRTVPQFTAPKTQLMALIIDGIFNGELPWSLVLIGVLISVVLELSGVPSLPFAVGVYLPITASVPIFFGGAVRWLADRLARNSATESESSPGILLSSGYIAGGTIAGVLAAMLAFLPQKWFDATQLNGHLSTGWNESPWPALAGFFVMMLLLLLVGSGKLLRSSPTGES